MVYGSFTQERSSRTHHVALKAAFPSERAPSSSHTRVNSRLKKACPGVEKLARKIRCNRKSVIYDVCVFLVSIDRVDRLPVYASAEKLKQ